jgi:hypothetical protein
MKNLLQAAALAGLFSLGSVTIVCQAPQTAAEGSSQASLVKGAIVYAELSKTVDAKKAKPGDPVTAQLSADVVAHGKIMVPRDSKLIGHVTEARPYTKENTESRLGIVFDKVILKGGQEVSVQSVLLAIHPAPRVTINPLSGPSPPGTNPAAAGPAEQKHYPTPKGPSPKMNTSMGGELRARDQEMSGMGPTDIEGLSLSASTDGNTQAIVSYKRTVKLEGGVQLELRVTDAVR